MESHVSVFASVDSVCASRDVKDEERMRYEAAFGSQCDIGLVFREATAVIGKVVKEIRTELEGHFVSALSTYERYLDTAESYRGDLPAAEAAAVLDDKVVEKFQIFREFAERAKRLRGTSLMVNNQEHFISNRARGHAG